MDYHYHRSLLSGMQLVAKAGSFAVGVNVRPSIASADAASPKLT